MNKNYQNGATLIVVLVLLIMIIVVGTLATKSSLTSLNIATNSQAQQLLFQSNDSALFHFENPDEYKKHVKAEGLFGYFLIDPSHSTDQLVVCFKGSSSKPLNYQQASIIKEDGSINSKGENGYCKSNDFSTSRSAVISQLHINRLVSDPLKQDYFAEENEGVSTGANKIFNRVKLEVTVISVLPSFSQLTDNQINDCFKKKAKEVEQCFAELNIPLNVQRAEYFAGVTVESAT